MLMLLRGRRTPEKYSRFISPERVSKLLKNNGRRKIVFITRNPDEKPGKNVSLLWISSIEHPKAINPRKLHVIEQKVWDELNRENAVVVLDGLEYLLLENGPETTLRFVGKLRDMAILTNSNIYIVVSEAIDEKIRNLLRRIVE
ncbi:DUF835 domain-containing protein [Thermococcus sp.]|uniref:DUF835 domain-containing protein n=1 Tax=Thermococcus sp. TaxID=35749 RepID=UPI00260B4F60|nr:DUF835 domain-containing protein [Thermococcus sp.]